METEGPLPCLQLPATCPCTEPEQSSPCSPIPLPEDPPMPSVFFISISQYLSAICSIVRGQFKNQPPIGWLKKYKIENKILLYGTVTYITALLLHTVAIHIYALVVP